MRRALILSILACLGAPAIAAAQQTFPLTITLSGTDRGEISVQTTDGQTFGCYWAPPYQPLPLCGPGSAQTASIASGSVVTVSAGTSIAPVGGAGASWVPGLLFAGSGPAASCERSVCRFIMTGAASLDADFSAANGTAAALAISLAGDATGAVDALNTVCQNAYPFESGGCAQPFYYLQGTAIPLSASPGPAARFAGYTAAAGAPPLCGGASQCSVTLTESTTVSATFRALLSVAISPSAATARPGDPAQAFTAIGTFTDGVIEPVGNGRGTWLSAPQMPTGRAALAAASIDRKLYAVGGGHYTYSDPGL